MTLQSSAWQPVHGGKTVNNTSFTERKRCLDLLQSEPSLSCGMIADGVFLQKAAEH